MHWQNKSNFSTSEKYQTPTTLSHQVVKENGKYIYIHTMMLRSIWTSTRMAAHWWVNILAVWWISRWWVSTMWWIHGWRIWIWCRLRMIYRPMLRIWVCNWRRVCVRGMQLWCSTTNMVGVVSFINMMIILSTPHVPLMRLHRDYCNYKNPHMNKKTII